MRRAVLVAGALLLAGCGGGMKTVTVDRPAQQAGGRDSTAQQPTAAEANRNAFAMLAQQYGPGAGYKLTIEPCQRQSLYKFFCVFKAVKTGPDANPIQNVANGVCVEFSPTNKQVANAVVRPQSECT